MPLIPSRRPWSRASLRAFLLIVPLVAGRSAQAQVEQAALPAERVAARAWYQDAKFGMFIHWGVYSQLGQGEWVMQNRSIPVGSYEWLASAFNPVKFDAREWVALAKAAGVRYITITSRHHDGFSMFGTKATRYNIVDWTPFRRDPLAELADECRKQGIRLFFYYSQLDWHHPDYWPRGGTGRATQRPDSGVWSRYLDFMDSQLTELLTNYGPIGGIWFDGMWDKADADWRLAQTYALIHRLQPAALIVPNHHKTPLPGEDVQTFEQDLPGSNTAGFNTKEIGALPLETSLTMNESWGFNITDRKFKSQRELIGYLVRAAGAGANLLLNIGPRPDGTIQPDAAEHLRAMGEWLRTYGVSIYGTRAGPVPPRSWGATTQRGDTVFVHVLDWPDRQLSLPDFGRRVTSARSLADGATVEVTQSSAGITVSLPPAPRDSIDRVIVLTTKARTTS
ncbi:MAG TPA: alpha-L-fucosidase [Gemmatimonadaceae bacterium]|nr:alpha-L-fucosidase [Gemmatimonadaceae bacterium]